MLTMGQKLAQAGEAVEQFAAKLTETNKLISGINAKVMGSERLPRAEKDEWAPVYRKWLEFERKGADRPLSKLESEFKKLQAFRQAAMIAWKRYRELHPIAQQQGGAQQVGIGANGKPVANGMLRSALIFAGLLGGAAAAHHLWVAHREKRERDELAAQAANAQMMGMHPGYHPQLLPLVTMPHPGYSHPAPTLQMEADEDDED